MSLLVLKNTVCAQRGSSNHRKSVVAELKLPRIKQSVSKHENSC